MMAKLVGRTMAAGRMRVSICDVPDAARAVTIRELVAGELFRIDRVQPGSGWAHGAALRDGYPGWVRTDDLLMPYLPQTHVVRLRETPVQPEPKVKCGPSQAAFSFGTRLALVEHSEDGRWSRVQLSEDGEPEGWVYTAHLRDIGTPEVDPVEVALRFLGTPYVWGGNSGRGIDCSGLVQAALLACGIPCPGDSGPQREAFAEPDRSGPFDAGELLFWKGHVAMATGPLHMIHANGHHMQVTEEEIEPALARIRAAGDGDLTGRGRPSR